MGFFDRPKKGRPRKYICNCDHNVFPNICEMKTKVRIRNTSEFTWMSGDKEFYCDFCWNNCMQINRVVLRGCEHKYSVFGNKPDPDGVYREDFWIKCSECGKRIEDEDLKHE